MLSCYRGTERLDEPIGLEAPMFRLGAGIFETLLYNGRCLVHLDLHLARLARGLVYLNLEMPSLDWNREIFRLLEQGALLDNPARVNLHVGVIDQGWNPGTLILAASYVPPPIAPTALEMSLEPHLSCVPHKTMSHIHYLMATRAARLAGFFDRILLGRHGEILETGSGALLFLSRDGRLICPLGGSRMDSTSLEALGRSLELQQQEVFPDMLPGFHRAFVVNALVGALPVNQLGLHRMEPCLSLARELRSLIWDL